MKKYIFILFLIAAIYSCNKKGKEIKKYNLNIERIIYLDKDINYWTISYVNALEILFETDNKFLFVLYNKKTKKNKKLIYKGKGPNEFLYADYIENPNDKLLFLDDLQRVMFEINKNGKVISTKKFDSKKQYYAMSIEQINPDLYISTGMFHNGRFGLTDSSGNLIKELGYYPIKDSLTIDNYFIFNVFQSYLHSNPKNRNIFATTVISSDLLEIFRYDEKTKNIYRLNKLDLTKTRKYKETNDNNKYISTDKGIRNECSCVTDKYIYVLYNKYTLDDFMKDRSKEYCNEVRVYDWKGNMVKKYFLEKPAKQIYVYDNELYALGMNDKYYPELDVYKLKD